MRGRVKEKLRGSRGVSVLFVVLIVLIVLMIAAVIFFPSAENYFTDAGVTGCEIALNSAQRKVDMSLALYGTLTEEEAMDAATQHIADFSDLCPAGGDVYLDMQDAEHITVVCGLHDTDLVRRCRLNATHALERINEALENPDFSWGDSLPDSIAITENSVDLTAFRVEDLPDIHRGTRTTSGYDGTVLYYVLRERQVVRFLFADENHCMIWRYGLGWDMDT